MSKVVMAKITMAMVAGKSKHDFDNLRFYAKSAEVEGLIKITDTLGTSKEYGTHDSYKAFLASTLGLDSNASAEAIAKAAVNRDIIAIEEDYVVTDPDTQEKRVGTSWSVDMWL